MLNKATPAPVPNLYLEFARRLTTTDTVLTLNYDLLLERALDAIGLPYRRFPSRYADVHQGGAWVDMDHAPELVLIKLHGSVDWVSRPMDRRARIKANDLVEGPRLADDPLHRIGVIPTESLEPFYEDRQAWWRSPPLLFPPSTAKPLARSPLVPLWEGWGRAGWFGGLVVIGSSLPVGDPYVLQVLYSLASAVEPSWAVASELPWAVQRTKVVDLRLGEAAIAAFKERFRFLSPAHTDFILGGLSMETIDDIVPSWR